MEHYQRQQKNETTPKWVDPVCGMPVNPAQTTYNAIYQGEAYYFCSPVCKERFEREPETYLKHTAGEADHTGCVHKAAEKMPPNGNKTIYLCPMDPEIRQKEPSTCPKCGMSLGPEANAGKTD